MILAYSASNEQCEISHEKIFVVLAHKKIFS